MLLSWSQVTQRQTVMESQVSKMPKNNAISRSYLAEWIAGTMRTSGANSFGRHTPSIPTTIRPQFGAVTENKSMVMGSASNNGEDSEGQMRWPKPLGLQTQSFIEAVVLFHSRSDLIDVYLCFVGSQIRETALVHLDF